MRSSGPVTANPNDPLAVYSLTAAGSTITWEVKAGLLAYYDLFMCSGAVGTPCTRYVYVDCVDFQNHCAVYQASDQNWDTDMADNGNATVNVATTANGHQQISLVWADDSVPPAQISIQAGTNNAEGSAQFTQ